MRLWWTPDPDDADGPPSGWSANWQGAIGDINVRTSGGTHLEIDPDNTHVRRSYLLNQIGEVDLTGGLTDFEIYCEFEYASALNAGNSNQSGSDCRFGMRINATTTANAENGYVMGVRPSRALVEISEYASGTASFNGDAAFATATYVDTRLCQRIRVDGNNLMVRWWVKGDAEPETWTVSTTDNTTSSGRVGLFSFSGGVTRVYGIGLGYGDDKNDAPSGPPPAPPVPSPGLKPTYYTDFSNYPTGQRPADCRRHRTSVNADWDMTVVDDAGYTGGKKLAFTGDGISSRVLTLDYVPATVYQEIVVKLTAGTVNGPVGGVVVGSTTRWDDSINDRRIGEFGARVIREGGQWRFQLWRYNDAVLLAHDNDFISINAWFGVGTFACIRLRRDPRDTAGGANPLGTVKARVWQHGTAEPSTWDLSFPITEGTPPGPLGIYGNNGAALAQYDWVGVSTTPSHGAPTDADEHVLHVPAPVTPPDTLGYTVRNFGADTIGEVPAGWEPYYQTDATFTVEESEAADNGRVLRGTRTGSAFRNFLRYTGGVGTDQEILVKVRYPTTTTFQGGPAVRLNSGDDACGVYAGNTAGHVGRYSYKNGTAATPATVLMHPAAIDRSDWMWMRMQARGSVFRGKVWQADELEPSFWAFEVFDNAASVSAGGVGVSIIDIANIEYDIVAVSDIPVPKVAGVLTEYVTEGSLIYHWLRGNYPEMSWAEIQIAEAHTWWRCELASEPDEILSVDPAGVGTYTGDLPSDPYLFDILRNGVVVQADVPYVFEAAIADYEPDLTAGYGEGYGNNLALVAGYVTSIDRGYGEGQGADLSIISGYVTVLESGYGEGFGKNLTLTAGSIQPYEADMVQGAGEGTGADLILVSGYAPSLDHAYGEGKGAMPDLTYGSVIDLVSGRGDGHGKNLVFFNGNVLGVILDPSTRDLTMHYSTREVN